MLGASFKQLWRSLRGAKRERSAYEVKRAELMERAKLLDEVKQDYDEARANYARLAAREGRGAPE